MRTSPIATSPSSSSLRSATRPGSSPSAVRQTVPGSPSTAFVPLTVDGEWDVCVTRYGTGWLTTSVGGAVAIGSTVAVAVDVAVASIVGTTVGSHVAVGLTGSTAG